MKQVMSPMFRYELLKKRYSRISQRLRSDTDTFSPLYLLRQTEATYLYAQLKDLERTLAREWP